MLKRQIIIYNDGRKEDNIIFVDNSSPTTIYPQQDNIKHSFLTTFKYKVKLKQGEAVALVRFANDVTLYPSNIKVHPQTTMDDIEVIRVEKKVVKQEPTIHKFESSSSSSIYTVREVAGKYKCNCSGYFRVKDKEKGCKHIQKVRSQALSK